MRDEKKDSGVRIRDSVTSKLKTQNSKLVTPAASRRLPPPAQILLLAGALAFMTSCATVTDTVVGWYDKLFSASESGAKPGPLPKFKTSAKITSLWQAQVGESKGYLYAPAFDGESVYAAGENGRVVSFDSESGKAQWRLDFKRNISAAVGYGDGLILMASANGEVLAYDRKGQPMWSATVGSEMLAPPQAADGIVVARAADGKIFGLDSATGQRKWVYQRATPALTVRSNAGVVLYRGAVFAGFPGGKLIALNLATGGFGWEATVAQPRGATEVERVTDVTSNPVVDDRRVCAAAFQGRVACFDILRGTPLWAKDVSSISGLSIDGRNVYVTDDKSVVLAYDKDTGREVWKQTRLKLWRLTAPLVYGDHLIVGGAQGYLHLLNRSDGAIAARVATDGSTIATAPIALDEGFLAQTRKGNLYALR
ncbi:MAG TPA: outer membrane protein assembly factor BamB [Burkholderiales bacterium]|nr:outer membrane protein assembly factor BamB [Burkholderiales bacterium]